MLMRWPARWRRPVRFASGVGILALLGYVGAVAYLYAYQIDLVFRPPSSGSLYAASIGLKPERVVVTGEDGLATEAWRVRAAPGASGLGGYNGLENREIGFAGTQCVGGQRRHLQSL